MTTYSAIANTQIDADSYLDTVLAAQWRDNLLAIQEGDASASGVRIQTAALATGAVTYAKTAFSNDLVASDLAVNAVGQSEIAANSIGQSEVKTTYQEETASAGSTNEFIATGGIYCIGHTIQGPNADSVFLSRSNSTDTVSYQAKWLLSNGDGVDIKGVRLYYITASRPYDLGDGEIPLFIEVEINRNSEIISTSSSTEASWHYNGPTNITPSRYAKDGKTYREIKDMSDVPGTLIAAMQGGSRVALDEYNNAFRSAPWVEQELTQDIKNADMDIVPLTLNNQILRPDNTTIILDPVSDLTWELFEMTQHSQFSANEFIEKWCDIDNTPLVRNGPKGVDIVGFKKRLTRR